MKRTVLFVLATMVAASQLFAQSDSIPNKGLESWVDFTSYENPEGWFTPNVYTNAVQVYVVFKETEDVYQGQHAARLESKIVLGNFKSPGTITLGIIVVDFLTGEAEILGGIPFSSRPEKLKGHFKYEPAGLDSCGVIAVFTKFTPLRGKRDTIGLGIFKNMQMVDQWTEFTIDINYFNENIPDTMNIIALSSFDMFNPVPGSVFWVDALELEGPQGIGLDILPQVKVNVYPNPATDRVNFELEKQVESGEIIIYNPDGREIMAEKVAGESLSINISDLPAGTYYYHLLSGNKRAGSGSFIVQD